MSAHAGIFYRNGATAFAEQLEACIPSLERLGPEGGGQHVDGSVAFVHRIYHVTPESYEERQPYASGKVTSWDGRLDNREDIRLQLRDSYPPLDVSDAAYAHAAFRRWGSDAFGRLMGEWAMAAWDSIRKELYLARDYTGAAPLFYYMTSDIILWSSELEAVVALAKQRELRLTIDEGWIAGFLARGPYPEETPYSQIRAVEPGCFVRFGTGTHSTACHTTLDLRTQIYYRTDAEYEEHFRFLFREAVSCRLRCTGKIFSHLSGGLDSSSVTAMAANILQSSGSAAGLETVSSVYNDTPASDESEYIRLMEQWLGLPSHHVSESDFPALSSAELGYQPVSPSCIDIFAASQLAIRRVMEERRATAQLSGEGGDELLGNIIGAVLPIRDLLQKRSWSQVPATTVKWCLSSRRTFWEIITEVASSPLPSVIAARFDFRSPLRQVGSLLTHEFKKRNRFEERLFADFRSDGSALFSQQRREGAATSVIARISACAWRRIGPMAPNFPMMDRRFVSFLLAIPIEQIARPGSPRSLQRRALRSILPPKLLIKRSKRSPDAAMYRRALAVPQCLEGAFHNAALFQERIADETQVRNAIEGVRRGSYSITLLLALLQIEFWMRRSLVGDTKCNLHKFELISQRKEVST